MVNLNQGAAVTSEIADCTANHEAYYAAYEKGVKPLPLAMLLVVFVVVLLFLGSGNENENESENETRTSLASMQKMQQAFDWLPIHT